MSDMKKWDGWKQQGQTDKNETGGTLGAVEKRKQEGMKNLESMQQWREEFCFLKVLQTFTFRESNILKHGHSDSKVLMFSYFNVPSYFSISESKNQVWNKLKAWLKSHCSYLSFHYFILSIQPFSSCQDISSQTKNWTSVWC